jgi:hypothetical protein
LREFKNSIAKDVITATSSDVTFDKFKTTSIEPKKGDVVVLENEPHNKNNTDNVTIPVVQPPNKGTDGGVVVTSNGAENKKFRGFFRKATRILERTTSINAAEDDKVLIGGMAINLK